MNKISLVLILILLTPGFLSQKLKAKEAEVGLIPQVVVPYFVASSPLKVITQITNNENIPQNPQGFLLVFDLFGNLTSQTKLEEVTVNPQTTKTYENFVGGLYLPGPYKLILSGFYGSAKQTLTQTVSFWYFPYKTLIPLFLFFAIFILFIVNWGKNLTKSQKKLEQQLLKEEKEIKKLKEQLKNI